VGCSRGRIHLAQAHQELGQREAAIRDCERALALQPENHSVAALLLEELKGEGSPRGMSLSTG